mgnify:CR=1 FL=1
MQDSITFSNAKKTDPIANLDKPVSSITLRNTIDRAFSQNQISTAKYIVVNSGSKKIKIDPESIYYLKAASSNCEIHLKETEGMKRYLASNPMGTVAHILPPNIYCQVHRSYIVNLNKVFAFQGNRIFMDKALTIEIPISPSYLSKFKSRFYSV